MDLIMENRVAMGALREVPPEEHMFTVLMPFMLHGRVLVLIPGIIAPLYFMWSVRHPKAE